MSQSTSRSRTRPHLRRWLALPLTCLASIVVLYVYTLIMARLSTMLPEVTVASPAERAAGYRVLSGALRAGAWVFVAWLAVLALLFVVGILLSRVTASAIERDRLPGGTHTSLAERIARVVYRATVTTTSVYFFVSIPVLAVITVALPALASAYFYIQTRGVLLAAAPALLGLYTLTAIVRSTRRRRGPKGGRGWRVAVEDEPHLWQFAGSVAERVGTRNADAIWLTPDAAIHVSESGSYGSRRRGSGERHLSIGLGALPHMQQSHLRSILAHEFAHFLHGDTAEGLLESVARITLDRLAYALAVRGKARWHNPVWLFVVGYARALSMVTAGASRLREALADRRAALAYGVPACLASTRHHVEQMCVFHLRIQNNYLLRLYSDKPLEDALEEQVREAVDEELSRKSTRFDRHPSPSERARLLSHLAGGAEAEPGPSAPVWGLFSDIEACKSWAHRWAEREVVRQNHRRTMARWWKRRAARRRIWPFA